jgi:hypothetical protein
LEMVYAIKPVTQVALADCFIGFLQCVPIPAPSPTVRNNKTS